MPFEWFVQVAFSCTSEKQCVDFQMFACLWLKQHFIELNQQPSH